MLGGTNFCLFCDAGHEGSGDTGFVCHPMPKMTWKRVWVSMVEGFKGVMDQLDQKAGCHQLLHSQARLINPNGIIDNMGNLPCLRRGGAFG